MLVSAKRPPTGKRKIATIQTKPIELLNEFKRPRTDRPELNPSKPDVQSERTLSDLLVELNNTSSVQSAAPLPVNPCGDKTVHAVLIMNRTALGKLLPSSIHKNVHTRTVIYENIITTLYPNKYLDDNPTPKIVDEAMPNTVKNNTDKNLSTTPVPTRDNYLLEASKALNNIFPES